MSAECKRISPEHVGPSCGCTEGACALDLPERIKAYGIDPDSAEGFRERLAYDGSQALAERVE